MSSSGLDNDSVDLLKAGGSSAILISLDDVVVEKCTPTASSESNQRQQQQQQLLFRLRRFQHRRDSLRLSASKISAMSGFHPYVNIPELLLDLVYQGSGGSELRNHDASLLGIEMISPEEQLLELADKCGKSTKEALQLALSVKRGVYVPKDIEEAHRIKRYVVREAAKTGILSEAEFQLLEEGSRSLVNTGFGTYHEDDALDQFQKQCRWPVIERNAALMTWPFREITQQKHDNHNVYTVEPMGSPTKQHRRQQGNKEQEKSSDSDDSKESHQQNKSTDDSKPPPQDLPEELQLQQQQQQNGKRQQKAKTGPEVIVITEDSQSSSPELPFFVIRGAVDGIVEELYCPEDGDGPDDWQIRRLIVELKHRMGKRTFLDAPPFYDQIQTSCYCHMYATDEAHIVQVLRKGNKRIRQTPRRYLPVRKPNPPTTIKTALDTTVQVDIRSFFNRWKTNKNSNDDDEGEQQNSTGCSDDNTGVVNTSQLSEGTMTSTSKTPTQTTPLKPKRATPATSLTAAKTPTTIVTPTTQTREPTTNITDTIIKCNEFELTDDSEESTFESTSESGIEIAPSRMSIDDPIMRHRENWKNVILPRLRTFVDAAYRIRADDSKRYNLLVKASMDDEQSSRDLWELVFQECPYFRYCDTAFARQKSLQM